MTFGGVGSARQGQATTTYWPLGPLFNVRIADSLAYTYEYSSKSGERKTCRISKLKT